MNKTSELIYVLYVNGAIFHTIINACISFQINFVLFIGIIIILVQKLQSPDNRRERVQHLPVSVLVSVTMETECCCCVVSD